MMMENDLVEISLRDGEEEVSLKRPGHGLPASVVVPQPVAPPGPAPLDAAGPPVLKRRPMSNWEAR